MAQLTQLPLEVIRMILQELYTAYSKEVQQSWSFSDAMKVHPVWQTIGSEIIHEEIGRIIKERTSTTRTQRLNQKRPYHDTDMLKHEVEQFSHLRRKICWACKIRDDRWITIKYINNLQHLESVCTIQVTKPAEDDWNTLDEASLCHYSGTDFVQEASHRHRSKTPPVLYAPHLLDQDPPSIYARHVRCFLWVDKSREIPVLWVSGEENLVIMVSCNSFHAAVTTFPALKTGPPRLAIKHGSGICDSIQRLSCGLWCLLSALLALLSSMSRAGPNSHGSCPFRYCF